jgi:hypothetical protein
LPYKDEQIIASRIGLEDLFKQLKDALKQCFNAQMQAIKDITNRCPIHLVIKNILVD